MRTRICPVCGGECKPDQNGEYVCGCCGNTLEGEYAPVTRMSASADDGERVFDVAKNAVVELKCSFGTKACSGSGYMITDDGYCVTNTHVVTDSATYAAARGVTAKIAGESVAATVIALGDDRGGRGRGIDLALIRLARVPRGAQKVTMGDFKDVRNGQTVYVVGNSLGMGTCITKGIVSDRQRLIEGDVLLMTDCAINPGNSGGPMFDSSARVIGTIVSGIDNAEGMNFAIPVDDVKTFLRKAGLRF